jgi:translation initiation factor IF-2
MSENTVQNLANTLRMQSDRLIEQLTAAGIEGKTADSELSADEKKQLAAFLQKRHGGSASEDGSPARVSLKRKENKVITRKDATGRAQQVNVEVRKRRTYVKRDVVDEVPVDEGVDVVLGAAVGEPVQEIVDVRVESTVAQEVAVSLDPAALQAAALAEEQAKKDRAKDKKPPVKADFVAKEKEKDVKKGKNAGGHSHKPAAKKPAGQMQEDFVIDDDSVGNLAKEYFGSGRTGRRIKSGGKKKAGGDFQKPVEQRVYEVNLGEAISVADLASQMSVKSTEVIKQLMKLGIMATINQILDRDTAQLIVEEMGHAVVLVNENALEDSLMDVEGGEELLPRAPIVTIMGHVDHGKTSLLDYIRSTRVASGEAGGITQHIGAYHVETDHGMVTFIDTPGHAAFTAMRARGAKVTDIVVLIVAADDGVMPQTIEAIQHAKAAGVELVVAINKIDKPEANPERVKQELSKYEVISEEWGGTHQFYELSAKTGLGVTELIDGLILSAEMLELRARQTGRAKGTVIESRMEKGRGVVTTVLVQAGTLNKGDFMLCGLTLGRVRAMLNEAGEQIDSAGPSIPVEVLGLAEAPAAGDEMVVVDDERKAREVANFRQGKYKELKIARQQKAKLDNLFGNLGDGQPHTVNLLIKADVQGSIEALNEALTKLSTSEVEVKVVASSVGGITDSDINLAVASEAIVIAFNVRAEASAKKLIEQEEVDVHYYSIIYEAVDEVKKAMIGRLEPEFREEIIGIAQVRDVFRVPKLGAIAGCMVTEGLIKRNNPIRVLRENVVIYEGSLESLRRFKDDVSEVKNGFECGIGVKNYNDVKVGDQIEVYERIEVKRTL